MAPERSGQITVTTAGTAVQGPSTPLMSYVELRALPNNTQEIWVGNVSGDVTNTNGYPLDPGQRVRLRLKRSLDELWFDASVNGEKVAWLDLGDDA